MNACLFPHPAVLHYAHSRRNWHDIQCNFASMVTIIDHWGDFGPLMQQWAGPGHFNDPDMLLVGNT